MVYLWESIQVESRIYTFVMIKKHKCTGRHSVITSAVPVRLANVCMRWRSCCTTSWTPCKGHMLLKHNTLFQGRGLCSHGHRKMCRIGQTFSWSHSIGFHHTVCDYLLWNYSKNTLPKAYVPLFFGRLIGISKPLFMYLTTHAYFQLFSFDGRHYEKC